MYDVSPFARISQKNAVNVYYLIGLGTLDETLWKKLNRKVSLSRLSENIHSISKHFLTFPIFQCI